MAIVNQIEKRVQMDNWDIIKYQILTHCYLQKIILSEADLNCLTFLAFLGEAELTHFCNQAADRKIFQSPQTVRNALNKAETKNLITKEGKSKKKIAIHPDLKVQTTGNILLDYKFLAVETQKV
jgi:hypothetical protein